jgi:hypothetical protein
MVTDSGLRLTLRLDSAALVSGAEQQANGTYAPWLIHVGGRWAGGTSGVQLAAHLPARVRIAARAERPAPGASTDLYDFHEWIPAPTIVFAGAAGYAVIHQADVMLAPSLAFATTDQPNVGQIAWLLIPAQCQAKSGLVFGGEFGIGGAFGGSELVDACIIPGGTCGQPVTRQVQPSWAGSGGLYAGWRQALLQSR